MSNVEEPVAGSSQGSAPEPAVPMGPERGPVRRWLPTRIRTKLIFLHTLFSLVLAVALLLALRPPLKDLMYEAESREALLALRLYKASPEAAESLAMQGVRVERGSAAKLQLTPRQSQQARSRSPAVIDRAATGWLEAVLWDDATEQYVRVSIRIAEARQAMNRLYLLLTLALLSVYGAIAVIVEVLVLPRQIYRPLDTLLRADDAAREGRKAEEIILEREIPADEIGQIMRSRNETVASLRQKEAALAGALRSLEEVAGELKRKNHLLETARRNLADADRLASLGMMSAGIAHELNTPLAVLKGSVEEIAARQGQAVAPERAALMLRVVRRLERLSESLLDFARARPPSRDRVNLREVVEEAWTLVSLDRDAQRVEMKIDVRESTAVLGDGDRLTQVMVNLLRNSVDALQGAGHVRVTSSDASRDGREWVSITVADSGPGIDPAVFSRLFEPFASTRMDSHGTGLGLAVAEGIVREHGGVILARNSPEGGATFEVMLPKEGLSVPESSSSGGGAAPVPIDQGTLSVRT